MLYISISGHFDQHGFNHADGPIELGAAPGRSGVSCRVLKDPNIGDVHLRIAEVGNGHVGITCLSHLGVIFQDNNKLPVNTSRKMTTPCQMTIGSTLVYLEQTEPEKYETIELPSGPKSITGRLSLAELGPTPTMDRLTHWLEGVIVDRSASLGPGSVYEEAARAVVDLVGLDRALVLAWEDGEWKVMAPLGAAPEYSTSILKQVQEQQRTYFNGAAWQSPARSLHGIEAVIASPIFGRDDQVIGALYGSRSRSEGTGGSTIGALEARVVQILATSVGVRLARQELDAEATRLRHQFEQFFSAELAEALELDRTMLDGRCCDVTVLFADIRGFSMISERLKNDPSGICLLVNDVMDQLTNCIRSHGGVVVDYTGDGLMAMWNAPAPQDRHASMACAAALAMLGELPALSERWEATVGGPLNVGFGINTGPVVVGNTGSRSKFKYGPLGHTVNLASRVEGATKQLGVSALITGATHAQLDGTIATRRICRARVVGIADSVDLYELHAESGGDESGWREHRDSYESALELFEAGELASACRVLYSLLSRREKDFYDVPSLDLIGRAALSLRTPSVKFNPIVELLIK